jgi:hypothetical protein
MKVRSIAGLLLLLLVGGVVYLVQNMDKGGILKQPEAVTIRGYVGGEKMRFLKNPKVVDLLEDRYGITFEATKAGSIEMVTTLPWEGQNCLWPSNQVATELHRRRGGPVVAEETVFNSPIVLYTWDQVAAALAEAGFVEERGGSLYVTDFEGLVERVVAGTDWSEVGLDQLYGKMKIFSTDPRRSNSGNMFSGLLANMMNGGEVVSPEDLAAVEPRIVEYFERMGYMEHSSGDIFENFLKTGMGAKPIIVGYENQLIEYGIEHREHLGLLQQRIRTLYPVPTVWSSHPIIALDDSCKKLIEAMTDDDIQRIAWEEQGFRSGLMGVENDPAALPVTGIPTSIDAVIPMPGAEVMERLIDAI